MTAYTQCSNTSSAKQNNGRKREASSVKETEGAATPKPLVTDVNTKRRLQWCYTHNTWSIDKWKKVDNSFSTHFPTTGRMHFWKTPAQVYNRDCFLFQLLNMEMDLAWY
ncbi:DDE_3 domain-containing protein [Trichonephila clavipes]|nr:DDE_3 domain-containing protein [Trichonephila clavipes]